MKAEAAGSYIHHLAMRYDAITKRGRNTLIGSDGHPTTCDWPIEAWDNTAMPIKAGAAGFYIPNLTMRCGSTPVSYTHLTLPTILIV